MFFKVILITKVEKERIPFIFENIGDALSFIRLAIMQDWFTIEIKIVKK